MIMTDTSGARRRLSSVVAAVLERTHDAILRNVAPGYTKDQLHKPERLEGETMDQYRDRRRASQAAARAMQRAPHQQPALNALDYGRFWLGQRGNGGRKAKRSAA